MGVFDAVCNFDQHLRGFQRAEPFADSDEVLQVVALDELHDDEVRTIFFSIGVHGRLIQLDFLSRC